ncbi:MAG: type III polyketide synthase [Streptomycetales bacterium]
MTRLAAVHGVLPPHRYAQREITEAFADMCLSRPGDRRLLERFHAAAGVGTRHFALPLDRYRTLEGFGQANGAFIDAAMELGEQAVKGALAEAGLTAPDVDLIVATSVTGIATPSIDARLVGRLGLREDVKRIPVFGLGCVAGAAGIARLHDYLRAWPEQVAVLLSVELCSLTMQRDDASPANLVASALFGDGAAAVVAVGEDRARSLGCAGPRVVATRSRLYPSSERVMGWDIGGSGFRIVLDASVADVVEEYLGRDVGAFLDGNGLSTGEVGTWVCHPGGPKVLEAMQRALRLPAGALERTWRSLEQVGNLSSASVLLVLRDTMAAGRPAPGEPGVLLAMGPGFCSELVLLRG